MATLSYYNKKSAQLIDRYDNAEMSLLNEVFLKHIPKNNRLLDIGFGSGRDLDFFNKRGHDIWGIDPTVNFVEYAKKRFPNQKSHFFRSNLPFNKDIFGETKFDAIICIAVLMHLKRKEYPEAVKSMINVSSPNSVIIISYSIGQRAEEDERYFEEVDLNHLSELFSSNGYILIDTVKSGDTLNRDSLTWITVVFKHD